MYSVNALLRKAARVALNALEPTSAEVTKFAQLAQQETVKVAAIATTKYV